MSSGIFGWGGAKYSFSGLKCQSIGSFELAAMATSWMPAAAAPHTTWDAALLHDLGAAIPAIWRQSPGPLLVGDRDRGGVQTYRTLEAGGGNLLRKLPPTTWTFDHLIGEFL